MTDREVAQRLRLGFGLLGRVASILIVVGVGVAGVAFPDADIPIILAASVAFATLSYYLATIGGQLGIALTKDRP